MIRISPVVLFIIMMSQDVIAQVVEKPLPMNPQVIARNLQERQYPEREGRGAESLSLPFVDDFSVYSLPTNDPDIPVEQQRWTDNSAFLNADFPVAPPTVGVATLEGLDKTGYPYNFTDQYSYGPADTLTSCPIDLSNPNGDVYLSFYYQSGGIGNAPEEQDSLILEFFASDGVGGGTWHHAWSIPGPDESTEFERVFVPITNATLFFEEAFQFRFRNYATLSGAADQWNIDYVILDDDVDPEDANIVDVAYVYDEFTLLDNYSRMPWQHFMTDPAAFMADSREVVMRNLENQDNNVSYGFQVGYEGDFIDIPNVNVITAFPAESSLNVDVEINEPPYDFVFDTSVNDTCAFFDVEFYLNESVDANRNNDTIKFVQEFNNFYAYDDGTAERAFTVNAAGGKVAMRYETATTDTLLGLFMHWIPFEHDNSDETFLLRVWGNDGGSPGEELIDNFQFHSPQYHQTGHNAFTYYEYDEPVVVSGTFYVGWVQDSNTEMNIGNDKNTFNNTTHMFYDVGNGWQQHDGITGSLMVRPVFKAGKSAEVSVAEENAVDFSVYPNPATDHLNLTLETLRNYNLKLVDLTGKEWLSKEGISGTEQINISDLPSGMYIIQLMDVQTKQVTFEKIIKQ